MAISKEFLKLFSEFVTNYKLKGGPGYLSSKESNFEKISLFFENLKNIIEEHQQQFNDNSIIAHANSNILLSSKSNPILLECWVDFLKKYNKAMKIENPLENNFIQVIPEGAGILEYQNALKAHVDAQVLMVKAHQKETELLRKQIDELSEKNQQLQIQVTEQQFQIRNQAHLVSMTPEIETTKLRLAQMQELLANLQAGIKPQTSAAALEAVAAVSSENGKNQTKIPTPPSPRTPANIPVETTTVTISPPPPAPVPPPRHIVLKKEPAKDSAAETAMTPVPEAIQETNSTQKAIEPFEQNPQTSANPVSSDLLESIKNTLTRFEQKKQEKAAAELNKNPSAVARDSKKKPTPVPQSMQPCSPGLRK